MPTFEPGKFYYDPRNFSSLELYFFQAKGLESSLRGLVDTSEKGFPTLEEIKPLDYLARINSKISQLAAFAWDRFFNSQDYTRASRSSP